MKGAWWILAAVLCAAGGQAVAQEGKALWEEYDKLISKRTSIASLGPDLFGDSVDLASGALSFGATDVSLPGNSGLAVAVGRRYSVINRKGYWQHDLPFADWDLDVPRISGTFAPTWHDDRCSGSAQPPVAGGGNTYLYARDYWHGNHADLPGGGEMLIGSASATRPATGGPWRWTTNGQTWFSCSEVTSIRNGSGEGFLAVTADGTKYWFDWMAQYLEPELEGLPRRKNVLYATLVEDRFGNWVTYTYTNAATAAARLTAVNSSDGRQITVGYNANGHIGSVSDGSHTWTYQYSYPTALKGTLTGVVLPDGSRWSIDFNAFSNALIEYNVTQQAEEAYRNCFNPGDILYKTTIVGTVSHPSGATGTFTVFPKRHGRSNVPALCGGYSEHNDPNDDVAYYPINWDSFTLTKKELSGPGLTTGAWTYGYGSDVSWYYPSGSIPVCQNVAGCEAPRCTDDSCAGTARTTVTAPDGSWTRYTFGNSYRYNEGKLLRTQRGKGATTLYTERNTYELAQSGQPFPTPIGDSSQSRGNGFVAEYVRPLKRKEIVQDGAIFVNEVEQFDAFARPLRIRKSSTGTGGFHIDPPAAVPTLTAPASSNTGSYGLTWTAVSGASHYQLDRRVNGGSWSTVHDAAVASWSASGQSTGTYDYRVRGCNEAGCAGYSAIKTTAVTLPPAAAPTVTVPASDNDGAFTASWTAVSGTTEYRLEQRKDAGSWSQIYSGAALSKAVSGLMDGTYDYRARACNTGGCSAYSAIDTTVVTFPPGSPPTVTSPASDGDGAFTVTWTSVTASTSYRLEQRKDSGSWSQIYSGTALSKAVSGLTDGSYGYRARACNAGGCSAYSAIRTTVVTFPPGGVPTVTAPSNDTDGAFTVSWTSVSATTDYRLEQRKNSGSWGQVYSGTALSKALSGLTNGTYEYRARACNAGGCGAYSTVDTTVVLFPPGSAPTVTAPDADNNGAFTVSWTGVSTASEYRLEQRKDGGSWSQAYAGTGTAKAISGLTNGSYDYRARACNSSGCGSYSAVKTTVVTLPPASAPSISAPLSVAPNQNFNVSWGAISTATSYELQLSDGAWSTIYTGAVNYKTENHRFDGEYVYRVRACNVGGCGPFSATKKVFVVSGGGGGGGCGGNPCPQPDATEPPEDAASSSSDEGEGQ